MSVTDDNVRSGQRSTLRLIAGNLLLISGIVALLIAWSVWPLWYIHALVFLSVSAACFHPRRQTVRERRNHRPKEIDFEQPCQLLKVTDPRPGITNFFLGRTKVAVFEGGPCRLYLSCGREYSHSEWTTDRIKQTVLPKGSATLAYIADHHHRVVTEGDRHDGIMFSRDGTAVYYQEGELEIVAQSETPLDRRHERILLCRGRTYKAVYTTMSLLRECTELYAKAQQVATVRSRLFWRKAFFKQALPLLDCVFICLLLGLHHDTLEPGETSSNRK